MISERLEKYMQQWKQEFDNHILRRPALVKEIGNRLEDMGQRGVELLESAEARMVATLIVYALKFPEVGRTAAALLQQYNMQPEARGAAALMLYYSRDYKALVQEIFFEFPGAVELIAVIADDLQPRHPIAQETELVMRDPKGEKAPGYWRSGLLALGEMQAASGFEMPLIESSRAKEGLEQFLNGAIAVFGAFVHSLDADTDGQVECIQYDAFGAIALAPDDPIFR